VFDQSDHKQVVFNQETQTVFFISLLKTVEKLLNFQSSFATNMAGCSCYNTAFYSQLEEESQRVSDSGGYNCSFVEEPDSALICLICMRVLRKSQLTDCCGNHYCCSCLKRWLKNSGGTCPLCREKFGTLRDKKVERSVHGLHVSLKLNVLQIFCLCMFSNFVTGPFRL